MSVTEESLDQLERHWAVQAVGRKRLERARQVADYRLVNAAVGRQMTFEFTAKMDDGELLELVGAAYEVAAIEGLDAILNPTAQNEALRDQAKTAAFRAYEFRRVLTIPT